MKINNVLIASDSFKGSSSSLEVATNLKSGILEIIDSIHIDCVPIADGGEGTVACFVEGFQGEYHYEEVTGPIGEKIMAKYGLLGSNIAVLEVAETSGLTLLSLEKRNPFLTTSYGLGELIKKLMDQGIQKFYIGLGGSATNDAGIGMAQALGYHFFDEDGNEVSYGANGLMAIKEIDCTSADPRLKEIEIHCITDVENILCGPTGASYVYGTQKGANPSELALLDEAVSNFAAIYEKQFHTSFSNTAGAGAAGGIGAIMSSKLIGAKMHCGIHKISEILQLDEKMRHADLVITGEGKLDYQSLMGKAPSGIATLAKQHGIPTIAICGSYEADIIKSDLFDYVLSIINKPMTLQEAMTNSPTLLIETGRQIGTIITLLNKNES